VDAIILKYYVLLLILYSLSSQSVIKNGILISVRQTLKHPSGKVCRYFILKDRSNKNYVSAMTSQPRTGAEATPKTRRITQAIEKPNNN
jgi:hypothetical protein